MVKVLTSLSLIALLLMTTAQAQTVQFNQKRSIEISGIIDETALTAANKLLALAETSSDPVDILISSPGGSVSHGLFFIQAMKIAQVKGVQIRCFVPTLAASMAFTIFTQCNEKYALPYSRLLFHAPRIGGNFMLTPDIAERLFQGLTQIQNILLQLIIPAMGVTKENGGEWFVESYREERMFLGSELFAESPVKWFTLVNNIKGAKDLYPNPWARSGVEGNSSRYVYKMDQK